jgi:hypothetical protein
VLAVNIKLWLHCRVLMLLIQAGRVCRPSTAAALVLLLCCTLLRQLLHELMIGAHAMQAQLVFKRTRQPGASVLSREEMFNGCSAADVQTSLLGIFNPAMLCSSLARSRPLGWTIPFHSC